MVEPKEEIKKIEEKTKGLIMKEGIARVLRHLGLGKEEIIKAPIECTGMKLASNINAIKVFKKPIGFGFEYAKEDGMDGSESYKAGDAVLTGMRGGRLFIQRDKFEKTYDIVGEGQCVEKKIEVLALKMNEPFTVRVSWSKDPLTGRPGDMLLQYGEGNYGIVSKGIYEVMYETTAEERKLTSKLSDAAKKGKLARIEELLDEGADVNMMDENWYTPLHYASKYGHLEAVKLLIEKGADVMAMDGGHRTPLDWTINEEVRTLLLAVMRKSVKK